MFFNILEKLCMENGMTVTELVLKLGLSSSNATYWKTSTPRIKTIKKIADYFNVSIEYFLEDAEVIADQPMPSNAYPV